jgi:hypothetical protein
MMVYSKNGTIPQLNRIHIQCGKYDTLRQKQSLKNNIKLTNYGHHAHSLSSTQVAPDFVNKVLTMNIGRVKPENPRL